MKNITKFENFKEYRKLNEETYADPRAGSYGGGGDTYFANVKGNMAGWENTLIGAGVAKIFGFFRRKVNEGILFLYKKALFREYLACVLRYAAKNDFTGEDPNTLYKIKQLENLDGSKEGINVEEIEVKFTNEKKLMSLYLVGSKVLKDDKPLEVDGKYLKIDDNTSFDVKDGIIIKMYDAPISKEIEDKINGGIENMGETIFGIPVEEFEGFDKDILDLFKNIDQELKNVDTDNVEQLKNDTISQLKEFIKELDKTITEIEETLKTKKDDEKNDISSDQIIIKEAELKQTKKEKTIFEALIKQIEKSIVPQNQTDDSTSDSDGNTPPTGSGQQQKQQQQQNVNQNASFNFTDGEFLNEEFKISKGFSFRGVKLFGVDKKLADEVGNLDMSILENKDFAKKFEPKEVKEGVTALVKENYAPIVKIQLAAERMWADSAADTNATLRIKNTWAKMSNDILALFSRYMYTDQVNPAALSKDAPDLDKLKQDAGKLVKSAGDAVNDKAEKNSILGLVKGFPKTSTGVAGILKTDNRDYIYINDEVTINTKKYSVLKIIGIINNMKKLEAETDETKIKEHITYKKEDLYKVFNDNNPKSGNFPYMATYFIQYYDVIRVPGKSTSQSNQLNVFNIYSDNKCSALNKDYTLSYIKKNQQGISKIIQISVTPQNITDDGVLYTNKIEITDILYLKDFSNMSKYGIDDTMKTPKFSDLIKDPKLKEIMEIIRKK